jgi:hypothetical protein
MYDSSSIQRLLNKQLRKEENYLKNERYENNAHDNGKIIENNFIFYFSFFQMV